MNVLCWSINLLIKKSSRKGLYLYENRPVGILVENITNSAGGLGFDSRASQSGQCRQQLAATATFVCCPMPRC